MINHHPQSGESEHVHVHMQEQAFLYTACINAFTQKIVIKIILRHSGYL